MHVHNSADIRLFSNDDLVTLEYNDAVILTFTPDDPDLISTLGAAGQYIRNNATVKIIDDDRKLKKPSISLMMITFLTQISL